MQESKYKKICYNIFTYERSFLRKPLYTNLKKENYQMLEMFSSLKGIKKNFIINEALEYYFNLVKTIPEEFLLKPIYISCEEFERLEKESKATKALKKLLNED